MEDEDPPTERWGRIETPSPDYNNDPVFPPDPITEFPKRDPSVEISATVRELIEKETPETLFENMPGNNVTKTSKMYHWDDTIFHSD